MHEAAIFRRVVALIEEAGISGERACPQTLRNSFAADLFDQEQPDALVAEFMGLVKLVSVTRLKDSYQGFLLEQGPLD